MLKYFILLSFSIFLMCTTTTKTENPISAFEKKNDSNLVGTWVNMATGIRIVTDTLIFNRDGTYNRNGNILTGLGDINQKGTWFTFYETIYFTTSTNEQYKMDYIYNVDKIELCDLIKEINSYKCNSYLKN